jgi:glutathione peroxidase
MEARTIPRASPDIMAAAARRAGRRLVSGELEERGMTKRIRTVFVGRCVSAAAAVLLASLPAWAQAGAAQTAGGTSSFYELKTNTLDGKPVDLGIYKGKVALVVNVASKCGYTPQYAGLEQLWREVKEKGVVVLGFPSNDFGGQEPGTPEEIATFCRLNYGVSFPLFSKVVTKAGAEQSPIYAFLGRSGNLPAWNFSKYVVDRNGRVVAFFPSKVAPDAAELRDAITKALAN